MFAIIQRDINRYIGKNGSGYKEIGALRTIKLILSHPGLFATINHRFGCWILKKYGVKKRCYYRYFFNLFYYAGIKISIVWGKMDIMDGLPIGPGLYLSDEGGMIIGAESIGENCTISGNVTIGMDKNGNKATLGDNVVIGCDTIVYGPVVVADGCVIDRNTVLNRTMPIKDILISGNPGKIIKRDITSSGYFELFR